MDGGFDVERLRLQGDGEKEPTRRVVADGGVKALVEGMEGVRDGETDEM